MDVKKQQPILTFYGIHETTSHQYSHQRGCAQSDGAEFDGFSPYVSDGTQATFICKNYPSPLHTDQGMLHTWFALVFASFILGSAFSPHFDSIWSNDLFSRAAFAVLG
ncbi:hypothetical protein [Undibacterium sp. TS12]|uniref:hypothetical protein n=1 Tax=Undibacterium sp. TS12 TaxID=2908202 RepID=UPI001F4CA304|nr:hypothetical protein [Undibacterium sp. TS12]MCH8622339.1 hypothetical protein [Undibacterium sp. TS12]